MVPLTTVTEVGVLNPAAVPVPATDVGVALPARVRTSPSVMPMAELTHGC